MPNQSQPRTWLEESERRLAVRGEQCGHPGLAFLRLLDGREKDSGDGPGLCARFAAFANRCYGAPAYKELLTALRGRQQAWLAAFPPGWQLVTLRAQVQWRAVVGLSYGRLWEVGLQFHPLYGVPYLPASGLKGALRNWAVECGAEAEVLDLLFGTTEQAGRVALFDAFPEPPASGTVLLREDILNKHHAGYYEAAAESIPPPAEWDAPVPVKFLTVGKGIRFGVYAAIAPGAATVEAEEVKNLLRSCLLFAGVGAKTRKGYGRMTAER